MAPGNPPRDVAIRVLARVLSDGEPLDQALAQVSGEVNPSQRGWLQEVCSGTLRWKGRLDQAIDAGALKKKPSGWLRRAMLVGAYQLIGQERTSPAAVVSETVSEVKRKEGEAPAKFVNASLRKVAEHAREWRELPFPAAQPDRPNWASLPDWIWFALSKERGPEWARDFALASLERPALWVRARRDDWKPAWAEAGPVPRSWKASEGGSIPSKEGFAEGEFIVQDISSQRLVSEISAVALQGGSGGRTALDLCAAPGGKAVGMAWEGLQVTASDRDSKRLSLLQQTLERAPGTEVSVIPREQVQELAPQDLVWIDAPCSGSGIVRRHPDVRWLRKEKDLAQLDPLQAELIQEGFRKVRQGGLFAYSVCSVFKREGEEKIRQAGLAGEVVREWNLFPQDAPHGDGFWAVLFRKNA